MEEFYRIRRLPPYVFEKVNQAKAAARNAGADIIDMGMGNPDLPAPPHVLEKLKETLGKPRTDRYSASRGINGLRKAQAAYYGRRFGVKLNPDTQIVSDGLVGDVAVEGGDDEEELRRRVEARPGECRVGLVLGHAELPSTRADHEDTAASRQLGVSGTPVH